MIIGEVWPNAGGRREVLYCRFRPSARIRLCSAVRSVSSSRAAAGDVPVGLVERLADALALGGVAHLLQIPRPRARPCVGPHLQRDGVRRDAIAPALRIAIRSTTFRSSRTFPGQP